jgi:hypothetical protein
MTGVMLSFVSSAGSLLTPLVHLPRLDDGDDVAGVGDVFVGSALHQQQVRLQALGDATAALSRKAAAASAVAAFSASVGVNPIATSSSRSRCRVAPKVVPPLGVSEPGMKVTPAARRAFIVCRATTSPPSRCKDR